jgi:hypothetical protein
MSERRAVENLNTGLWQKKENQRISVVLFINQDDCEIQQRLLKETTARQKKAAPPVRAGLREARCIPGGLPLYGHVPELLVMSLSLIV